MITSALVTTMGKMQNTRDLVWQRTWIRRLVVLAALLLLAGLPPLLDPVPASQGAGQPEPPTAAQPWYAWARASHLFW